MVLKRRAFLRAAGADETTETLPVALFSFTRTRASTGAVDGRVDAMSIPVVLAAVFGRRYLVAGLTAGATKG